MPGRRGASRRRQRHASRREWPRLPNGGPGEDTLIGGSDADKLVDTSGPTLVKTGTNGSAATDYVNVSDGGGNDTVICESANSYVIADSNDKVGGECGPLVRTEGG